MPTHATTAYIGAVGIGVSDLARSADFYTRVLGMKVITTFKLDYMDEVGVGFGAGVCTGFLVDSPQRPAS
jgi:catechol 2,3-dioxygenase-like lactoylglutathione lyase family enzyme